MGQNLMSFVSDGPYLHSTVAHFRRDAQNRISKQDITALQSTINAANERLSVMAGYLKTAASDFLVEWGGDYKKASRALFAGEANKKNINTKNKNYIRIINRLLNSYEFIHSVQRHTKTGQLDATQINKILEEYHLEALLDTLSQANATKDFDSYVDTMLEQIIDPSHGGKRIFLKNDQGLQDAIAALLNKSKQHYFQNQQSLRKQLLESIKKRSVVSDWEAIYRDLKEAFLREFPNDAGAEDFISNIRNSFISKGKKLKAVDYSNITGAIGENLEVAIQEQNTITLSIYDAGERSDAKLVEYSKEIANKLKIQSNQISVAPAQEGSIKQSGTDWIIVNKQGKMIRAQVKNSVKLMEEMRSQEGKINRPQPIKIQETIQYLTLQEKIKSQNEQGGLTEEEWQFLDYLVVNYLWFRVDKSSAKSGSATSIADIKGMIDRLLSVEIGYFLGAGFTAETTVEVINKIIGQSNVFFVLDNAVLYPTYLIIEAIQKQLQAVEIGIAKLSVTLDTNFDTPDATNFKQQKDNAKDPDWDWGQEYGEGVLAVGRNEGQNILNSAQISRVNLVLNINQILQDVYGAALKHM